MPILFNNILLDAGLRLSDVRLLRHKDTTARKGRTPYELWRDDRGAFNLYQAHQRIENRPRFGEAPFWASFVATPDGSTLFAGLYKASYRGLLDRDTPMPHREGVDIAGTCDVYDITLDTVLSDLVGRLFIEWGARAWIQRPDNQNKSVVEFRREFKEREFPGFSRFVAPLSELQSAPRSWIETLRASRGVYLLTCPKTREQYVGSAAGEHGFWGRWEAYLQSGHGGNIGLKSRNPSDYQVSILEVAGSTMTENDVLELETLWKTKLQSREMGLNRN
jgi:hypothetical protein